MCVSWDSSPASLHLRRVWNVCQTWCERNDWVTHGAVNQFVRHPPPMCVRTRNMEHTRPVDAAEVLFDTRQTLDDFYLRSITPADISFFILMIKQFIKSRFHTVDSCLKQCPSRDKSSAASWRLKGTLIKTTKEPSQPSSDFPRWIAHTHAHAPQNPKRHYLHMRWFIVSLHMRWFPTLWLRCGCGRRGLRSTASPPHDLQNMELSWPLGGLIWRLCRDVCTWTTEKSDRDLHSSSPSHPTSARDAGWGGHRCSVRWWVVHFTVSDARRSLQIRFRLDQM